MKDSSELEENFDSDSDQIIILPNTHKHLKATNVFDDRKQLMKNSITIPDKSVIDNEFESSYIIEGIDNEISKFKRNLYDIYQEKDYQSQIEENDLKNNQNLNYNHQKTKFSKSNLLANSCYKQQISSMNEIASKTVESISNTLQRKFNNLFNFTLCKNKKPFISREQALKGNKNENKDDDEYKNGDKENGFEESFQSVNEFNNYPVTELPDLVSLSNKSFNAPNKNNIKNIPLQQIIKSRSCKVFERLYNKYYLVAVKSKDAQIYITYFQRN